MSEYPSPSIRLAHRHRSILALILFLVLAQSAPARAQSGAAGATGSNVTFDWPGYLGPHRNAVSAEPLGNRDWAAKEPERLWKTDVGAGCSAVAIAGGKAYTMGHRRGKDRVLCLDALTGKKIWEHAYSQDREDGPYEGGPTATPTVDDGRVYTVSKNGDLFCLDAMTGKPLWSKNYVDDFDGRKPYYGWSASPLVHGDLLFVDPGGPNASVVALNKETGEPVWKSGDDEPSHASPVHFDTGAVNGVAFFQKTGLSGYALEDGRQRFHFNWTTEWNINASLPLFFDDKVFISSGYGSGCAVIDFSENAYAWRNENLFLHFQHGIVHEGHIYAVSGDNETPAELKCLDLATGDVRWSNRYGGSHRGNLLLLGRGADEETARVEQVCNLLFRGRQVANPPHVFRRVSYCALSGNKSTGPSSVTLLVLTENGELILADPTPERYIELHRMQAMPKTCWASPAFANGLLYCRTNDGDLRCYDLRP